MKIKFKKILATTIILGILFPSLSTPVLAVTGNPNGPTNNDYYSNSGFNVGNTTTIYTPTSYTDSLYQSATTAGPENYVEKNAEQAKSEAETLKQQQDEDKNKCESDAKGGAALSNKFKDVMESTIKDVLNKKIQETVSSGLGDFLTPGNNKEVGKAGNRVAGGADLVKTLQAALSDQSDPTKPSILNKNINKIVTEKMKFNLAVALDNATNGGTITNLDDAYLNEITSTTLKQTIHESIPEAIKLSVKEALPIAVKNSFKLALPELIEKGVTDGLDPTLNPSLKGTLRENISTRLGPTIFSKLSEKQENGASPIIGSDTDFLGNIIATLGQFSTNSSDALEKQTYGYKGYNKFLGKEVSEEGEVDKMTNDILAELTKEGPDSFQQQTIDQILAGLETSQTNPSTGISSTILDDLLANIPLGSVGTQVAPNLNSSIEQALGGSLENIVGDIASGGDFSNIVSSLTTDLTGNLTGNLLGGVLDDALGGALGGVAGDLLSPITDGLNGVLGDALSPITGALDSVMNSVLSPITGALNNVMGTIMAPINNLVGNILGPLGGVLTDPIGTITSAVTGGLLFVPTKETPGQLTTLTGQVQGNTDSTANNTSQIDKTTKSMEKLTVDICTKTKALERQSKANEQKNFVEDPKMNRDATQAAELFRQAHTDWLDKGYDTDGDGQPDAPLYVQNYQDYVSDNREEAKNVYFDALKESDNIFKDETEFVLRSEFSDQSNVSTITKEDYNKFTSGQLADDPQEWNRIFLAINDISRPNSPETSTRINREKLNSFIVQKEEEAKNQLAIGEGYLPVRKCIERTADNTACKRWETTTPQVQVKETTAKVYDFRIDNYINPQTGDVAPGNEPQIEELLNFKPSTSGGGGAAPSGKNIGNIIKTLLGLIQNIRGDGPNIDLQAGQLTFNANTTPFSAVQAGQAANISTLSWSGENLKSCQVVSGWVVKSGASALSSINKAGDPLPINGSYSITLPLTFDVRFVRVRNGIENSLQATSTQISLAYDKKDFDLPVDQFQSGDEFSISFWPFIPESSVKISLDTIESSAILNKLQTAINNIRTAGENLNQKNLFNLYTFTIANGKIEITPNLTYKMSCVYDAEDNDGNIIETTLQKEVTIKR